MLARRAWHMLSQGRPEDPQGQKSGGTRLPGFVRSRRSDKPGLHQGGRKKDRETPLHLSQPTRFPYPAPAYSRSSSGAQIVGNGQGQGTPFWKEPHTRPRPFCRARPGASAGREGALSPKSFEQLGAGGGLRLRPILCAVERWLLLLITWTFIIS